jgi:hypothetical protein
MAKAVNFDANERFLIERWASARELAQAFRRGKVKMAKQLRRVASELEPRFKAQGYDVYAEDDWAELKAYRPEWCDREGTELAVFVVGALYPVGYFKVEESSPFACVFLQGLDDDDQDGIQRFGSLLRKELGGQPDGWTDRSTDQCSPLWVDLPDWDDTKRAMLALNPAELRQVALEQFPRMFEFGDAVGRAVQAFRSS